MDDLLHAADRSRPDFFASLRRPLLNHMARHLMHPPWCLDGVNAWVDTRLLLHTCPLDYTFADGSALSLHARAWHLLGAGGNTFRAACGILFKLRAMADNIVVSSSELLGRLLPMVRLSALRSYGSDAKVSGRYVSSRSIRCTAVGRRSPNESGGSRRYKVVTGWSQRAQ